jgi:DNA-directed RNA polymerase specialized sigma24 family protein
MTPEANLKRYTQRGDQAAFGAVAAHFTPLVYGMALQRSGRAELAVEIAQDVFLACARKAPSLVVQAGTMLRPWLHRTTLYESMNHLRKEAIHRRHVSAAAAEPDLSSPPSDAAWLEALPHLDEALNELPEKDRTAVLMRCSSAGESRRTSRAGLSGRQRGPR